MQVEFNNELDSILGYAKILYEIPLKKFCVAVSGGADSLSLLFFAYEWALAKNKKLCCVTIDHNLRNTSYSESLYVKKICEDLKIDHYILKWHHGNICKSKVENEARIARYSLLTNFCEEKGINIILTGHTLNDRIETYEMRKLFGSQKWGLAGISRLRSLSESVKLIRPIMNFKKSTLKNFLLSKNILWIEDEMNEDENFIRVKVRKDINKYSDDFLQNTICEMKSYTRNRRQAEEGAVRYFKAFGLQNIFSQFGSAFLDIKSLQNEELDISREIVSRVVYNVGGKDYKTNLKFLSIEELFKRFSIARVVIHKKQQKICVFRENRNFSDLVLDKHALWDGRFFLKSNNIYTIKSFGAIKNLEGDFVQNFNKEYTQALYGIPCLFKNGELQAIPNLNFYKNKVDIENVFKYKVSLLDVFI